MKVWINQFPNYSAGGLYRVIDSLVKYLPKFDVEIVEDYQEADVAHCHISTFGAEIDKPLVISSHGMLWEEHSWNKLADKINGECLPSYRLADVVTAPSDFVARAISRYTLANPLVVRHGIDPNEWLPGENQGYVVWNKARIDPANNPEEMNRLAELAKDIQFYSTFGKETSNVDIIGRIPPEQMPILIKNAGVYLDTPLESGGPCFGVLEAMSCAVPVLAWDFGGNAESIIHKETGYLAKPYNYRDLLEGLHYCLEHKGRLGNNGRQCVIENYSLENSVRGYVQAYKWATEPFETKVSVVIPCHNLGEFLPHCLDSVLDQSYENFKVVVIDDASTDNSWEIIQRYADTDYRVIPLQNKTNQHVSASRNRAIEALDSQYILPLDADDRLAPGAIRLMADYLDDHKDIDIVAGHLRVYHESDLDGKAHNSGWPNGTQLDLQLKGHNRLPYSSMYTRKLFNRSGGYRTRIRSGVEDADFWTRALSYGYKAHLLEEVTLKYTHREKSLGKTNEKGTDAWLGWYSWKEHNCPANLTEVHSFYPPDVSIVIPVGPGHGKYIQACIDSLVAQTYWNWEVIVVNDSVEFLQLPAFVRTINNQKNMGVAYSRNVGVEAALADKIIFLDADDIAQPGLVEVLISAHLYAGGWIYGDWYINKGDGKVEYSASEDWDYKKIIRRSLGPITGLYEKEHIELVGGFDEEAPGWEDWDFHLKLVKEGICGTRIEYPLITYNMHLGQRREDNFKKHKDLLKYIQEKHKGLRENKMACKTCGGKRTLVVERNTTPSANIDLSGTVLLEYQGQRSKQRLASKNHPGTQYIISTGRRQFPVFADDLEYLLNKNENGQPMFKVVRKQEEIGEIPDTVLVSEEVPEITFESFGLDEKVINLLKSKFASPEEVKLADDNEILSIRGIGEARLAEIRLVL